MYDYPCKALKGGIPHVRREEFIILHKWQELVVGKNIYYNTLLSQLNFLKEKNI